MDAFYGYAATELLDGTVVSPDHSSTPSPVGTFSKRATEGWTVIGFSRGRFCDEESTTVHC